MVSVIHVTINNGIITGVWLKTEFGYYFISLTPTEIETAEQTCTSMGGCLHVAGDYINSGCNKTIAGLDIGSYFYSCFIEEGEWCFMWITARMRCSETLWGSPMYHVINTS